MPTLRFARYQAISREIAARLTASRPPAESFATWPEEIIVASYGVAQSISAAILEAIPQGFAGLRLQTIETLARRIVNARGEFPRIADDAERRLAMRLAVASIPDPILETRGIASMLERTYRDVRDSGLRLGELRRTIDTTRGLRNVSRTRLLLRVWETYERLITEAGAIDPADLLDRAATIVELEGVASCLPQFVAGFYDATGSQMRLLTALREAGRIESFWIPIDGDSTERYRFAERFIRSLQDVEVEPRPQLSIARPQVSIAMHDTRENEVRSVCSAVAALIRTGTSPATIGVVGRTLDAYDVELLRRFAGEYGFRFEVDSAKSLASQRIGRALVTLLQLRDDNFPRHAVFELVRDGFRAKTKISVDQADRQTRQARIAGGTVEELRQVRTKSLAVGDYIELVGELEEATFPLRTPLRAGEWSDYLRKVTARLRVENDGDLDALAAIDELGDLLRRGERWSARIDIATIVDLIRQTTLRERGGDETLPRIWAGDVMRFRGRTFDHLFVIRMQDDLAPQRRVEDALLPDSDRQLLGIREIGNGRDEEELLFQLMLDNAGRLHFSFAGSDGFGKPLRPSPLLKTLAIEEEPEQRTKIIDDFATYVTTRYGVQTAQRRLDAPRPRPLQMLARLGTNGVFDGFLQDPLILERIHTSLGTLSPTQLEDFGECPQKFLLKHLLGVTEFDDPDREVQIHHREKGSLDHKILEAFYRDIPEQELAEANAHLPALAPRLASRLEAIIDAQFDAFEQEAPPFNRAVRSIELRATKRILRTFITADITDLITRELVPRHFEYSFGEKYERRGGADHPQPFTLQEHGIPLRVEGRIDRIDVGPNHLRVIDYKSGKALRHEKLADKIDKGLRLQLALYAMAISTFMDVSPENVSGAIKPLVVGDAKSFGFILGEKRENLLETLRLIVDSIAAGRFPAVPFDRNDVNVCKYCPAQLSCRTKHDRQDRQQALQHGDAVTRLTVLRNGGWS